MQISCLVACRLINELSSMIEIPLALERQFDQCLANESISREKRVYYIRWLRFYLDFCHKYDYSEAERGSLDLFDRKLEEKRQGSFQRKQASASVELYYRILEESGDRPEAESRLEEELECWAVVLRKLKECILTRHYSKKTLSTYAMWVKQFRDFLKNGDPANVTAEDAAGFFTYLATVKKVAASTQNQAFNALLFLFKHVFKREFEGFDGVVRAKRSNYIPMVLSREEVDAVFACLKHPHNLIVKLLYGCGLRRFEVVNIRVNCLNFDAGMLTVHDGKGKKDRVVPLPQSIIPELKLQVNRVRSQLVRDNDSGFDGVFMPEAMSRKFKNAAKELPWQWLFPARNFTLVPDTEELRRYHAHEAKLSFAIKTASMKAGLTKRVTAHTFRHSFASHLLENNYDIRTIQELLGHSDVKTTMIYTHTVRSRTVKDARSPLDF